MKRFLYLIPCLLLCCILVFSPVAASATGEDLVLTFDHINSASSSHALPEGEYVLSFTFTDSSLDFVSDPVYISEATVDVCINPDLVTFDEIEIYQFTICNYGSDEFVYEFTNVFNDSYDLSVTEAVVTFTRVSDAASFGVGVLDVFSAVGQWFVAQLGTVAALFVTVSEGVYHLTFFGIMTLVGIGLAVILLIIRAVGAFLSMRR